jgi:hypothetical protein
MAFSAELPKWLKDGTEPSESKKTEGWLVGEHPPADWFNWLFFNNYMALKEIQEKAVEKGVLAEFQEWATDLLEDFESRLNTISRTNVTLSPGVNILNATKQAPFSLEGLAGAMRVNLMGRAGGCESVGSWSSNVALASDTANKTSGLSSFKLTLSTASAFASYTFLTTPGKKYAIIADLKNGNTTRGSVSVANAGKGNDVTSASVFSPSFMRFAATDFFHNVMITAIGASGNTFNMDSVRIYEISEADYAAAASYTPAQAAAKWPYVDSVMPVRNPYAIRYGENLLPNFHEWTVTTSGIVTVQGPNKATAVRAVADIIAPLKVVVPVLPNTTYTMSSVGDGLQYIERRDSNDSDPSGEVATGVVVVGTKTFTTSAQTSFLSVRLRYASVGSFTHENPMLNIGNTAKPFKPREDSMLALQTDLYADPVTGANADTVFERDGQYFKSKKWQGLTLDGSLGWLLSSGFAGYKEVRVPLASVGAENAYAQKYDGKILTNRKGSAVSAGDQFSLNDNGNVYLSISVADSGWADSYVPDQNDIKAYFYGYKAYDANTITPANAQTMTTATWTGTGTKYWVQRVGDPNFTQSTPQQSYAGYTPYQLVYQLATPTVEPIVSEGQLSFTEGDNQVEVGTGIVLREAAKPSYESTSGNYQVNNSTLAGSALRNKTERILNVFRNNAPDKSFDIFSNAAAYGVQLAVIKASNYDPAAVYSVTYLMLDKPPVVPFTGSYAANEKTLLADLVDSVQQNTARVSVLENKKADKDNPAWLTPTLLNGWNSVIGGGGVPYAAGYYKDSSGVVHMRGWLNGGATAQATAIFKLPPGYRPSQRSLFICYDSSLAGTNLKTSAIVVNLDGTVSVDAVSGGNLSLYQVSYLAEQ